MRRAAGRGGGWGWQRSQAHRSGSSAINPALLTSYIKQAETVSDLFSTYAKYENQLNDIHLSACWNSLGQLSRAAEQNWYQENEERLDALVKQTMRSVTTGSSIRARELSNIAHGVAKSGRGQTMAALMSQLARVIELRLDDCKAQELANIAWAFAKAEQPDAQLFTAVARAAEAQLSHFNAQELANTAWAFASAGHTEPLLFAALARAAEGKLESFRTQSLANTAWAFARAGHVDELLFKALSRMAKQRLDDFNAQDLANTAWAFAKLGHFDGQLFSELGKATLRQLSYFSAQGVANIVWAFAKAGHSESDLFIAFADSIRPRLKQFKPQDLANTAWAFAKACHVDGRLFSALARATESSLDGFNTQDLVNTAWAFAKVGQLDAQLFLDVARAMRGSRLDELSAPHIANIAWAFAKVGQLDGGLFSALARSAQARAGEFSAQELANTAWAFANAGQLDSRMFRALAKAGEVKLLELTGEELDNAEWAFSRAGELRLAKALRRRRRSATAAPSPSEKGVDVSECGRVVVAGGGIGGAAAAVALQRRGFDVVVLEADSSFDARKQGYGLTIQRQDATQAMGINLAQDDAPSTSHYTFAADGRILGFFGEAFSGSSKERQESDNSGRFVHIPRQRLRARIVEQIQPGSIRWGSKLKSFSHWGDHETSQQGGASVHSQKRGVTVTLTDGTTLDAALLVGCDGIFSTVRRQLELPGDRLNYVGLVVALGIVPMRKELRGLTDRRIFETVDGSTRIYAMPFTKDSTMWQLSFPMAEKAARSLAGDSRALKEEIMRRCGEWHRPIPALLRSTPLDCMAGYPVYDRELLQPSALRSSPRRVTLMGDAAHPMTPFKAQGANQALSDAVLLADSLVEGVAKHGPHAGIDAALPLFEQKMLNRSARAVVASREKARELHSRLALQPARKVQRETGIDMSKVIQVLHSKEIGALSAADPRGLDAVVAEAIRHSSASTRSHGDATGSQAKQTLANSKNSKRAAALGEGNRKPKMKIRAESTRVGEERSQETDIPAVKYRVAGLAAQSLPKKPRNVDLATGCILKMGPEQGGFPKKRKKAVPATAGLPTKRKKMSLPTGNLANSHEQPDLPALSTASTQQKRSLAARREYDERDMI